MTYRLGWTRDLSDIRDFKVRTVDVKAPTKTSVDLRHWMPPVQDQGTIGSCTAHAAVAIINFYQKKTFDTCVPLSRLFLYKVTRRLAKKRGDSGAELRTTMQAMVMFGAPPEEYLPYKVEEFDNEPTAFHYALADDYRARTYVRHDHVGTTPQKTLLSIKSSLEQNVPVMFGMTVYKSFPGIGARDDHSGMIPMPSSKDKIDGGHAMVIAGFDDAKNAFLVRNSWGEAWGAQGYGWLPYAYVTNGVASDFWSLLTGEFTDLAMFA